MEALKGLERSLGVPAGTALAVISVIVAIIVVVVGRKWTSKTGGAAAGSAKRADTIVLAGPVGAGKTTLAYKVRRLTRGAASAHPQHQHWRTIFSRVFHYRCGCCSS